jgi:hypothetical protein
VRNKQFQCFLCVDCMKLAYMKSACYEQFSVLNINRLLTTYYGLLQLFLGVFAKLKKRLLALSCLSASAWNNLSHTERIFIKTDTHIFRKSVMKMQVSLKSDKNKLLHMKTSMFLIISCSFLLRMRNVSDRSCRENQNTHFKFNNFFLKIMPFMR